MNSVILYDGVCGLCNGFVQFVLKRDKQNRFQFAPLQSDLSRGVLRRHGINPELLDTVYLVFDYLQPTERLLARNEAVNTILTTLGGVWRLWAKLLHFLPQSLRDWGYNLLARNRYRIFGKYQTCPLPAENVRRKFLDMR